MHRHCTRFALRSARVFPSALCGRLVRPRTIAIFLPQIVNLLGNRLPATVVPKLHQLVRKNRTIRSLCGITAKSENVTYDDVGRSARPAGVVLPVQQGLSCSRCIMLFYVATCSRQSDSAQSPAPDQAGAAL